MPLGPGVIGRGWLGLAVPPCLEAALCCRVFQAVLIDSDLDKILLSASIVPYPESQEDINYRFQLDSILYTDEDLLHDTLVIRIGFIVSHSHHLPPAYIRIPATFNDAIVILLS